MNLRYERKRPLRSKFSDNTKIIWPSKEVETYYDTPKNSYCLFRKEIFIDNIVERGVGKSNFIPKIETLHIKAGN